MSESSTNDKLILKILNTVKDKNEMRNCIGILNFHINNTLDKCLSQSFESRILITEITMLEIESILDYIDDKINIGHWSEVPIEMRRAFTVASFVKLVLSLKFYLNCMSIDNLRKVLQCTDRGLLLGAPLENNPDMLTKSATIISKYISQHFKTNISNFSDNKIVRNSIEESSCSPFQYLFDSINATQIETILLPSVEQFANRYFLNQQPIKLKGCIDHWPARTKWRNIGYILKTAGERTVPVEIGAQYVDENWSQKLMTLREFVEKYYTAEETPIGYLAQHNLFDQIPELRKDIYIPEYCSLSRDYDKSCDPDINCWFGPAGTVSSLHYDPKNNLLAQNIQEIFESFSLNVAADGTSINFVLPMQSFKQQTYTGRILYEQLDNGKIYLSQRRSKLLYHIVITKADSKKIVDDNLLVRYIKIIQFGSSAFPTSLVSNALVYGTKQVLLFAPHDTQNLYPFEGELLNNTSQLDPLMPNLELHPNFSKALMYKCLLAEGEILFIPEKWWHHVTALEKSFSVSFWWQ